MAHARTHEIIPVKIVDFTDVGPVPIYFLYLACFPFMQKKEGLCVYACAISMLAQVE